jgi:hypothetical protein
MIKNTVMDRIIGMMEECNILILIYKDIKDIGLTVNNMEEENILQLKILQK